MPKNLLVFLARLEDKINGSNYHKKPPLKLSRAFWNYFPNSERLIDECPELSVDSHTEKLKEKHSRQIAHESMS